MEIRGGKRFRTKSERRAIFRLSVFPSQQRSSGPSGGSTTANLAASMNGRK
jgi:hypothetical protein